MTPHFPPLLNGHELKPGQNPARKAASGAAKGKYRAGDLLWVKDKNTLNYAIVLEPDVDRVKALDMVFVQMVALGDAIGAIAPPEITITYQWPNILLANRARIGAVHAILSTEDDAEGKPKFMVLATQIDVRPTHAVLDPGYDVNTTTLWDEGAGEVDALMLLDASARHFTNWVHTWEEDGFASVLGPLDGRMTPAHLVEVNGTSGHYLGLDEAGNLLIKRQNGTGIVHVYEALDTSIKAHL